MRADAEGQTALRLRQGAQRAEKLDRAVPGRFVTGMERQEAQREAKASSGVRAAGIGSGTGPVPAPGTASAPASVPFPAVVVPTSTGSMPSMAPAKVKRFSPMVT